MLISLFRWNHFVCICFSFEDLRKSLNKLSSRLLPWQPPDEDGSSAKVEDMMLLVDSMLEHTDTDNGKVVLLPFSSTIESRIAVELIKLKLNEIFINP